ncbi:glycoside hydrolase family 2 TIM barrel-domain containing protein [Flavitalea flava]
MKNNRIVNKLWQSALQAVIVLILSRQGAFSQAQSSPPSPLEKHSSPSPNDWENPRLVSQNTLPPHAHFVAFPNEQDALLEKPSPNRQILDGEWKFNLAANPSLRPLEFYKDDYITSTWKNIKVPANWQVEGWDKFIFTDVEYPIPPNPPFVPADDNPVGSYKRKFTIPQTWSGKKIIIHFGAVNSFFYLWINGQKVGFSKDSKTPAEFDITTFLRKGENTVSAQVFRFSDGTYLEGQDMWKLSGIERSVWLEAKPEEHVVDYFLKAGLINDYRDGLFDLTVYLNQTRSGGFIEIKLLDDLQGSNQTTQQAARKDKIVFHERRTILAGILSGKRSDSAGITIFNFHTVIPDISTWNAEQPNLYTLVINHLDKKGRLIESIVQRVGFRTIEIKHGLLLVNGVAIKIKGVNRHEHDMIDGKVISSASMLNDIRLFKQYNINAMRTSHYPNGEDWYSFCDKYGIYLIDEVNLECDGMSMVPSINTLSDKPDWKAAYLDRTRRMWERDKNHCSIITWSLGNESRFGDNFVATYEWLKSKDSTRPVQYEEARDNANTDIICPMYKSLSVMQEYVKEWRPRPFIQVEYAHMMGNSGGNLKDDWDLIYKYPQLQGGFIWDFCDQAFKRTDKNGRSIWAYGRDMGKVGNTSDTSFCADGLFAADRSPHPQAFELKKVYQHIGFEAVGLSPNRIRITNRFDFTNLRQFNFSWTIKADGLVVASGEIPELDLAPHQEKEIQITIPPIAQKPATEYFLLVGARTRRKEALLPENYTIAWQQFTGKEFLSNSASNSVADSGANSPAKPQAFSAMPLLKSETIIQQDSSLFRLYNSSFAVLFNKRSGWLQSYAFKGMSILKAPLQPHFWRAATDNDIGNSMQMRCAVWQDALHEARLDSFTVNVITEGRMEIRTEHYLPAVDARYCTQYIISGNGDIQVNVSMKTGKKEFPELPRFGMKMLLDPSFDKVTWLGRGPFDNYWDRQDAADVDVYSMPADSLFHPYARAQESGYRTDVRWMALCNRNGIGLMALGQPAFSTGVLHFNMSRLDFDRNADHNNHGGSMDNEDLIWWNIDYRQMGLGGDNSWGAKTHAEYTLPYTDYRYTFTLRPVDSADNLPANAKRTH